LIGAVDVTTIALGDFNDWIWPGAVQRCLGTLLPGRTRLRTFPARLPMFKLDRIFVWPRTALVASHTDLSARVISDHLPVIADLRMPAHEPLSGCRVEEAGLTQVA
jgi:endonuclease/exonuclease/phosphatase family metal-dependent hydrolase